MLLITKFNTKQSSGGCVTTLQIIRKLGWKETILLVAGIVAPGESFVAINACRIGAIYLVPLLWFLKSSLTRGILEINLPWD